MENLFYRQCHGECNEKKSWWLWLFKQIRNYKISITMPNIDILILFQKKIPEINF